MCEFPVCFHRLVRLIIIPGSLLSLGLVQKDNYLDSVLANVPYNEHLPGAPGFPGISK